MGGAVGFLSYLVAMMGPVMEAISVRFAATARLLGRATRGLDLQVPGFRSPPRLGGSERTVRRSADGTPTVAVRLRDRPWLAVIADMIEGVVVANELAGPQAEQCRSTLWAAVEAAAESTTRGRAPALAPVVTGTDLAA